LVEEVGEKEDIISNLGMTQCQLAAQIGNFQKLVGLPVWTCKTEKNNHGMALFRLARNYYIIEEGTEEASGGGVWRAAGPADTELRDVGGKEEEEMG
jgi:hypothetical protein